MRRLIVGLIALLWVGVAFTFAQRHITPVDSLPNYYKELDGASGKELLDAIQIIAKVGYRTDDFRYDSIWFAFAKTDMRPDGYVWEIYSDCTFEYEKDRTSNTTQTGDCKGYNREHAICQSWFGTTSLAGKEMSSSKKNSPGSDIFHIYPTSHGMNSRRGNRPYGEVLTAANISGNGTKYGTPVATKSVANSVAGAYVEGEITMTTNVLEPADEYKGDIARSYFGTMVKWAGEWAFNKNELGKVIFDATIDADTHYAPENNYGFTDYGLALMLNWHRQDPVSQKEVDRNNGIQQTQGNRNPFIDYPYLVEYIWGERTGEVLDFDLLLCSADERFELGISNGYLYQSDVDVIVDTVFWMVGDKVYETTPIKHSGRITKLPQEPLSCSEISDVFMGWTDSPITTISEDAHSVLYQQTTQFPVVNQNTYYYAVFAEKISSLPKWDVISLNKKDSAGWTLNQPKPYYNKTDGAYWGLVQGASVVSPQVDMAELDSIAMVMRTYGGASYNTVRISVEGDSIGCIVAKSNAMQRSVWIAPELTGRAPLTFTSVVSGANQGAAFLEISLYLGGKNPAYTNYLTHCSNNQHTGLLGLYQSNGAHKLWRDGKLYIQIDESLYDSMGRIVK